MDVAARLKASRAEVLRIAAENGASNVRIFGSVARGEAKSDSDIDFLVHLEPGRSLMDLSRLWLELEDLLGCKVDVVPDDSLHWYIRDRVLNEAVPL
jgi:predicted nucleotidyltransferase